MKSKLLLTIPLLGLASTLLSWAAEINIPDHSFVPDGSTTSAYQQTDIATPNGGNILPTGTSSHVAYFVTTFTCGDNTGAHLQANFRATGGQARVGVEIQDTGLVQFVGTGDTTRTNFNFNQDMAGQSVVLLVKAHYDPNHNVIYGKSNASDDTLFNVWINPTGSSVEGSGQSAGDMQTVWNSATFGFFGQTILNQSTPGTAGTSFITDTFVLTGADATFANALALATGGTPPTGIVDPATSTVSASPEAVPADGVSTSDRHRHPEGIQWHSRRWKRSFPFRKRQRHHRNRQQHQRFGRRGDFHRQAAFTVSSTTIGPVVFTATSVTDNVTVTQTATVDFTDPLDAQAFNVNFLDEGQADATGLLGVGGAPGETWNQGTMSLNNLVDTTGAIVSLVNDSGLGNDGRVIGGGAQGVFTGNRGFFGKGQDTTISITGLTPDTAYDLYIYALSHNTGSWGDISNTERAAGDFVTANTVLGNGQSQWLDNGVAGTNGNTFVPNGMRHRHPMKLLCHLIAFGSLAWAQHAHAQELNVLVIGSSRSFSEGGESGVVHEKPFHPAGIANHLAGILALDPAITTVTPVVNVVFEDIYKTKSQSVNYSSSAVYDFTSHCYSLAQHYFWPDGKAARLANLRGEGTHQWDCIVLCNDPYVMANFPGMVAEGVKLIREEVAKSANPAQVVLLAQWPENSSGFTADRFNEIAHRVGDSAGITVVPAGKAWNSYASQDTSAAHPTPRGEYLAAAAIYSKLFGRSATSSGYVFPSDGYNIANHANSVVQANAGLPQYTGIYTIINPFQMKQVAKRVVSFRETGTSTEDRLADALHRLDDICRITFVQNQGSFWDFNYGRGNDWWEDDKDYEVNPAKHDRAYGFPMHHYTVANALNTMPYGIDKHYYYGSTYEDGTDLGIAYNMIRPGTRELSLPEDVRAIPIRLMWQKMTQFSPGFNPLGDNTHMHNHLNDASAAFMYTLLSGRCPVVDEPATKGSAAWLQWLGHKIGYETAWQMSRLTTRTPGFRVLPSSVAATTVTSTTSETMTVHFANPPQADVTVNLTSSNPAVATVSPGTLTFTPSNHKTPQQVTVTGVAANIGLQNFDVQFATSSNDRIHDGLSDAWSYTSNTQPVVFGQSVLLAGFDGTNTANTTSASAGVFKELSNPHKSSTSAANVAATLSTTDAVVNGLQWSGMTSPSTWGSATFLPNATTTNHLVFAADNAVAASFRIQNTGTHQVTVEKLHFRLQRDNATGGSANQVTIALASGNLTATGPGVQALSASNGAFNYDFNLSTILTDATLDPGEFATFTFSAVPSDPAGTNRRIRVDNLAISGSVSPINTFANWIAGFDLGGQTGFSDDPDNDGLANGIENWFGTHPGEFTPGVLPGVMDTGTGTFTFTHPLGDNPASDVSAVYRWSKDLSTFHLSGQSDPGGTTVTFTQGTPSNGRVPVTATISGTATDWIFFDIQVTQN